MAEKDEVWTRLGRQILAEYCNTRLCSVLDLLLFCSSVKIHVLTEWAGREIPAEYRYNTLQQFSLADEFCVAIFTKGIDLCLCVVSMQLFSDSKFRAITRQKVLCIDNAKNGNLGGKN